MNNRRTIKSRRGVAAMAMAAALAFAMTGCGGDEETKEKAASSASGAGGTGSAKPAQEQPEPEKAIAEINGQDGIVFVINSAQRDSGGFVTVSGKIKNTGSENFTGTSYWRGNEEEIVKNGDSLGGATLIDKAGKKRYYVLRDTEGRPLATTSLTSIGAGKSVPFFAQFPAPPASTTEVDFQVPTLPTTTIKISE